MNKNASATGGFVAGHAVVASDGVAVGDGTRSAGRSDLYRAAGELAEAIMLALGDEPGPVVSLLGKSLEHLVLAAATLATPHFMVPLDPRDPPAFRDRRLRFWKRGVLVARPGSAFPESPGFSRIAWAWGARAEVDCRARAFPSGAGAGGRTDAGRARATRRRALSPDRFDPRDAGVDPESLAYAIFTSGSMGEPKGVPITRASLARFAEWVSVARPAAPGEVVAAMAPPWFDLSVWDLARGLALGSTVLLVPDYLSSMPRDLAAFLAANRATNLCWVPSILAKLREADAIETGALPDVAEVGFIGEAMPPRLLSWLEERLPAARFSHYYGPTEATVLVTARECVRGEERRPSIPLGSPRPGVSLSLVADDGREIRGDGKGELVIAGGDCLSPGYLSEGGSDERGSAMPTSGEKTVSSVVRDEGGFRGDGASRRYHAGDVVERRGDELYFSGRRDGQFKRRGIRLEAGEIEAAAASCPGVAFASVEVADGLVTLHWCGADSADPRAALSGLLPRSHLPDRWMRHATAPLGRSGKLDAKAWKEDA